MTVTPQRARNLRRLADLYAGHAAGLYTLPAELVNQRTGIVRLSEEMHAAVAGRPNVAAIETAHVAELKAAATAGAKRLPPATVVLDATAGAVATDQRVRILQRALEESDNALGSLAQDLADITVTDHLAPAIAAVFADVRATSDVLPEDPNAEALLRSTDEARQAWFGLGDLAARYDAIRKAAHAIRVNLEGPTWDTRGDFSELKNFDTVTEGMVIQPGGPRPWPADTAGRLLWFARHGGDVWLPTIAQMDQRYYDVNKEAIENQRRSAHNTAASRAAFA